MELKELHRVVKVRVLPSYRLGLTFDDGTYKEVDLRPSLEERPLGIFEPLLDPTFFARAELDTVLGTVVWPNGADFCPDVLFAYPESIVLERLELQAEGRAEVVAPRE